MKKTIGILLMGFAITGLMTGCNANHPTNEATIQETVQKETVTKETEEMVPLETATEKEMDMEIMSLEEQEENAKQLYDYFFDDYEISFRSMYKNTDMYISGDGAGFKPTLFFEGLVVDDKQFPTSIIYYDNSMFLYIQSSNGEDIDKDIPDPAAYFKNDIEFECKEWQRYDLSKSYLYSVDKGNDTTLEYLSSVLP